MAPRTPFWRNRKVLVLAAVTVAVGIAEGYYARRQYDAREADAFHAALLRLQQDAEGRARLIEPWVERVFSDAHVLASYPSILETLGRASRNADGEGVPVITPGEPSPNGNVAIHAGSLLDSFIALQGYRTAVVHDGTARLVLCSGQRLPDSLVSDLQARIVATREGAIDVFLVNGERLVVAGIALPLQAGRPGANGALLLAVDPSAWLYPQLLHDGADGTNESVLVGQRAGGGRVLLSPPRDLVKPVATHAFPSAGLLKTMRIGRSGSDTDHRGVEVLAASRRVAGTPWVVVSKVDRSELLAGFRQAAWGLVFRALAALGLVLAFTFAMLQRRQALHAAEQMEAARQIAFLNRLLLTISDVNELMVREKDRHRLLSETCRIIVENGGLRMAWVGEAGPQFKVVPVAQAGQVDGYLDGIDVRFDYSPSGRGPAGTAMRERRTVSVEDIAADPTMEPWRKGALERGYRAAVAVPLMTGSRAHGVLTVYSETAGVFRQEVLSLLERLANDLAFALEVIEGEVRHRETEQVLGLREEQLRQAQKMEAVGRLAGGVAHDFNNLLMAISGYAELALRAKNEDSRRDHLKEIAVAADRAAGVTRQLLAFSRKQVLQPKVLNLNGVVLEVEKLLRRLIGENIELVTSPQEDLHFVRADPGQMEQVLVNLAVNARDAMPDGGRLVIATRSVNGVSAGNLAGELEPGEYVELSVTDSGEGMPPDVLEHVFEPFFTTKELGKGTGLGLSTVYGIVKQSGGAITVESGMSEGTTFRVFLPVAAAGEDEQPVDVPRARALAARGERLLVVEDNAPVRKFVTEALAHVGYEVVDADSAEAALEVLADAHARFDLLLTDIVLPKMDGYELARLAVSARPAMRVLYMSGYTDNPKLRDEALREGVDLIEKPFRSSAIAARVREILDRPAGTA